MLRKIFFLAVFLLSCGSADRDEKRMLRVAIKDGQKKASVGKFATVLGTRAIWEPLSKGAGPLNVIFGPSQGFVRKHIGDLTKAKARFATPVKKPFLPEDHLATGKLSTTAPLEEWDIAVQRALRAMPQTVFDKIKKEGKQFPVTVHNSYTARGLTDSPAMGESTVQIYIPPGSTQYQFPIH